MLFARRKPPPLPHGFQIEARIGEARVRPDQRYDDLLGRELPDELGRLASQLNPSVVEVGNEPIQRSRRWARRWRRWRDAIARR